MQLRSMLLLYFCLPQFIVALETPLNSADYVHKLIFEEISAIKRKVWVDISSEIHSLVTKIDSMVTDKNSCICGKEPIMNNSTDEPSTNMKDTYLLKGFSKEKLKSRQTEERLIDAISKISKVEKELWESQDVTQSLLLDIKTHTEDLEKTTNDVNNIQSSVDVLKVSNENLRADLSVINKSCCNSDRHINSSFHGPSFISDWILMRAQDQDYVQRYVYHGLGVLPYKVEVQIRPTTGANSGWTFHGDPAFQSDDDYGEIYGGIVYLYNESYVILSAPIAYNNIDSGVIINTGESNNRRTGNNHQTSKEAYVRVKVWAPSDFPKPDFKTNWLPLDVINSSLSYYELEHGLSGYPEFINVQVRCNSSTSNVVSEGLGSTLMHRIYSNTGGVVYAFNDRSVRLWSAYLNSTFVDNGHYRLIGWSDGWGSKPMAGVNIMQGEFRILSWDMDRPSSNSFGFEESVEGNTEFPEWSAFEHISVDMDLLSFYVEANDGPNKGYRFRGYGNSQSIDSPFGGVVYAFNARGELRLWKPNAASGGHLIHVHSPYGNGQNVQASNAAQYVSTLIKTTVR